MTVSMRKIQAGRGYDYLLKSVVRGDANMADPNPVTRYYTEEWTPPGRWSVSSLHAFGDGELKRGDPVPPRPLPLLVGACLAPVPEEWFSAAWFRCTPGDGNEASARIKESLSKRIATQTLGQPKAGSVFRNTQGDHAARLIQSCGLKGRRIGGAEVSTKHANFIVNTGDATAADIERLIHLVRDIVARECGVRLEPEVRIIGEHLATDAAEGRA